MTSGSARPSMASVVVATTFLAFAFAYFLSALLRAVTATLAPIFSRELSLSPGDLGLLAGAYFLGFSLTQLPLGQALDRFGAKRVVMVMLAVAAVACLWFAQATTLTGLVLARMAIGIGVSACLMAPLTAYRKMFTPDIQLRANAWMLMSGSLGMLASTLPVHWLMPFIGWRGLFVGLATLIVLAIALIASFVPNDGSRSSGPPAVAPRAATGRLRAEVDGGYRAIFTHPRFVQLAPVGFFIYGGMVAVQALWAGPWLTVVAGYSIEDAAQGLFVINLAMLLAFFSWGLAMPHLAARGIDSHKLMRWGLALPLIVLPFGIALGRDGGTWLWATWCVSCTFVTLSQPRIALEFSAAMAGRALSAYNLVLFVGIFVVQWGLGLVIDHFQRLGLPPVDAFRAAFTVFGALCVASYVWYLACDRRISATPSSAQSDNPDR